MAWVNGKWVSDTKNTTTGTTPKPTGGTAVTDFRSGQGTAHPWNMAGQIGQPAWKPQDWDEKGKNYDRGLYDQKYGTWEQRQEARKWAGRQKDSRGKNKYGMGGHVNFWKNKDYQAFLNNPQTDPATVPPVQEVPPPGTDVPPPGTDVPPPVTDTPPPVTDTPPTNPDGTPVEAQPDPVDPGPPPGSVPGGPGPEAGEWGAGSAPIPDPVVPPPLEAQPLPLPVDAAIPQPQPGQYINGDWGPGGSVYRPPMGGDNLPENNPPQTPIDPNDPRIAGVRKDLEGKILQPQPEYPGRPRPYPWGGQNPGSRPPFRPGRHPNPGQLNPDGSLRPPSPEILEAIKKLRGEQGQLQPVDNAAADWLRKSQLEWDNMDPQTRAKYEAAGTTRPDESLISGVHGGPAQEVRDWRRTRRYRTPGSRQRTYQDYMNFLQQRQGQY